MRIRRRWAPLGAVVMMACGCAGAVRPQAVSVKPTVKPNRLMIAWARARPDYTRAELAEIFARFDPAEQIARDFVPAPADPTTAWAIAVLDSRDGSYGRGAMRFEQAERQVLVNADLYDLPPGEHGVSIHDAGSCAELALRQAGDWDPTHSKHGPIESSVRHVGDLGNLKVEADGTAAFALETDSFQITGNEPVVGKVVVIHARRDDGKTQPAGNSGPAIACGVVRLGSASSLATR